MSGGGGGGGGSSSSSSASHGFFAEDLARGHESGCSLLVDDLGIIDESK